MDGLPVTQQPRLDPSDTLRNLDLRLFIPKPVEPDVKLFGAFDAIHCRLDTTDWGGCQGVRSFGVITPVAEIPIATRAIMADLRAGIGQKNMEGITGGPAPFAKADRSRFLQALDEALARLG